MFQRFGRSINSSGVSDLLWLRLPPGVSCSNLIRAKSGIDRRQLQELVMVVAEHVCNPLHLSAESVDWAPARHRTPRSGTALFQPHPNEVDQFALVLR